VQVDQEINLLTAPVRGQTKRKMNLRKGNDPNLMSVLVDNIYIKPFSRMNSGMIEDGVIVKFGGYNLDDVLCQMLDDYGEDVLISRIKSLEII
jgi:hypothetical protein